MSWSLVSEFGIDYAAPTQAGEGEAFTYPALVERGADNTYLIVDELFFDKYVSITAECRTIRSDERGKLLYDSAAAGIHDGYGCLMEDGGLALMRRTRWELLLMSDTGQASRSIDLSTLSKGMPRLITSTWRKTFLLAFFHSVGRIDIAEIDRRGRLLWYLPQREPRLGFPGSIQLLPNDNILVADEFHHVALEFRRDGSIAWEFGERGNPGGQSGRLSNPKAVRQTEDGRRLIADTRNHRVLCLDTEDGIGLVAPSDAALCSPSFASATAEGHHLICDAGNGRVVELDRDGGVAWQCGRQIGRRRWFSFPRSVELTATGAYLVADTANNRIVEVTDGQMRICAFNDHVRLFWPRCVRKSPSGSYLVADGRNSRIIEVSAQGELRNELTALRLSQNGLGDPHDVRLLPGGSLLIVDALGNRVVETDWSGQVLWVVGEAAEVELNDPHSAQQLSNGDVVICDTGNSRILHLDAGGKIVRVLEAVYAPSHCFRLIRPRYAEVSEDGALVIADSDNNRILAASLGGELMWELSSVPRSRVPSLSQPRWIQAIRRNEIVVSDCLHHRILHLKADPH